HGLHLRAAHARLAGRRALDRERPRARARADVMGADANARRVRLGDRVAHRLPSPPHRPRGALPRGRAAALQGSLRANPPRGGPRAFVTAGPAPARWRAATEPPDERSQVVSHATGTRPMTPM